MAISDTFSSSGITLFLKILSIRNFNYVWSTGPPAIKSSDVILSGPGDLLLLSFFKAFSISDGVVGSMGEDSL